MKPRPAKKKLPKGRVMYATADQIDGKTTTVLHPASRWGKKDAVAILPCSSKRQAKEIVRLHDPKHISAAFYKIKDIIKDRNNCIIHSADDQAKDILEALGLSHAQL